MKRILFIPFLLLWCTSALAQTAMQWAGGDPVMGPSYRTTSTPVLGGELFRDPGFNSPGDWAISDVATTGVSLGVATFTVTPPTAYLRQDNILTSPTGKIYKISTDYTVSAGSVANRISGDVSGTVVTASKTQTDYLIASVAAAGHVGPLVVTAFTGTADNASCKQVTPSSLLAPTRPFLSGATVSVTPTDTNCPAGNWLGGAFGLNDTRNPTQGAFWWPDRTTGNMRLKMLTAANTWSADLVNAAFTYVSGQTAKFVYNKTTKKGKILYNNVQIGAEQDLSAYTFLDSNRRMAVFSTTAVNGVDSVTYTTTLF